MFESNVRLSIFYVVTMFFMLFHFIEAMEGKKQIAFEERTILIQSIKKLSEEIALKNKSKSPFMGEIVTQISQIDFRGKRPAFIICSALTTGISKALEKHGIDDPISIMVNDSLRDQCEEFLKFFGQGIASIKYLDKPSGEHLANRFNGNMSNLFDFIEPDSDSDEAEGPVDGSDEEFGTLSTNENQSSNGGSENDFSEKENSDEDEFITRDELEDMIRKHPGY